MFFKKKANMRMVVGLGNPGSEYSGTRHNAGFVVIDSLAADFGVTLKRGKFGGRVGFADVDGKKLILLKPWQYMNRSGQAVSAVAHYYKVPVSDILVVSDDMALDVGVIRIRAKGSSGGHNGLADIIEKLGTSEFARLRIGIGRCDGDNTAGYVLGRPPQEDMEVLCSAAAQASKACLCWFDRGINAAMNKFNK